MLGDAGAFSQEPIHSGVAENTKEFAILVDTKLFAKLSLHQMGFAAELSSLLGHFLAVEAKLNMIGMNSFTFMYTHT